MYREVKRGRFIKVGLGVYGLPTFSVESSAYSSASGQGEPIRFITKVKDPHSTIEGMLIELGNFYDFLTYTSNKNKMFDGKSLSSLESLHEIPYFTYEELIRTVKMTDVIWFSKKTRHAFPKYIHEVEHSTDFSTSMLKMFQLKDFDTNFVLCSWESRKESFNQRMNQEPFNQLKGKKFVFRSFELIAQLYFSAVRHFELQSQFLV